ncbi:MAG: PQQ-dependent sugar dehydrogenase [Haloarculaceae archaeon]
MDRTSTRRRLLRVAAAGAATGLAGCSGLAGTGGTGDDTDPPEGTAGPASTEDDTGTETATPAETATETRTPAAGPPPESVGLETLVDGLGAPVDVAFAPDADRRYVVEQGGLARVHEADGLREEPFLDLRDSIERGGEKGLLGLALHPEFAENRRAFVRYSAPRREGTPEDYRHTFVLAEFEAARDGRRVRRDSERALLEIPEPQGNHNAGDLAFGPDGYLYVAVGDGGSGGDRGDGHVEDWYDAVDGGNGQDVTENLLGSVLRIDIDGREDGKGYAVPEDNPLVGREGLDEHYAWGLRNPWRMSFDRGDLYVGDVGQNSYEEVNLVERGGNYGWNVMEGTHCFDTDDCPDETPPDVRGGEPLIDPIIEYPHSGDGVTGVSIIGGHVYRGSVLPALFGRYVFGDLNAGGRLFVATPSDGDGLWETSAVPMAGSDAGKLERILSFGRDADGELYVLGIGSDDGGVHRIVPAE